MKFDEYFIDEKLNLEEFFLMFKWDDDSCEESWKENKSNHKLVIINKSYCQIKRIDQEIFRIECRKKRNQKTH